MPQKCFKTLKDLLRNSYKAKQELSIWHHNSLGGLIISGLDTFSVNKVKVFRNIKASLCLSLLIYQIRIKILTNLSHMQLDHNYYDLSYLTMPLTC